jgi:hypothetical protein
MSSLENLMRTPFIITFAAIAFSGVVLAQESSSKPAESQPDTVEAKIEAIEAEMKSARDAWFKDYRAAKTDEEKTRLFKEKYPKPDTWFPRLYEVARAAPKSKDAETALLWIATRGASSESAADAIETLLRDHVESEGLAGLADSLGGSGSPKSEDRLKSLEARSPHKKVKGRAVYARADLRKSMGARAAHVQAVKDPEALKELEDDFKPDELARLRALDVAANGKEVEALLEQVAAKYPDVEAYEDVTLGDRARGDLFEIRNLAIGMVAPEIEGKDVDGKALRLSDFKGKVVVLDFWGNW